MAIKGIDVSAHQGRINWKQVAESGVEFAVLRVYCNGADLRFGENYQGASAAGIPVGAYCYSYATTPQAADREAQAVLHLLEGKTFAYPIYFDIEDTIQRMLRREQVDAIVEAFCQRLEAAGYFAGIYSYKYFLEQKLSERILRRYAVWVAHTGVSKTSYRYPYGMWQYSHTGSVNGISGKVDLNYAYLAYPGIMRKKQKNGFGTVSANPPEGCPYGMPTKPQRRGSKGDDVRWVQWHLIQKGYSCGTAGIDGSFGPDTERAVRCYQTDCGLEVDGVCGPKTRASLSQA